MNFDISTALQDGWDKIAGWLEGAVSALPNLLAALLLLLLFWLVAKGARRLLHNVLDKVSSYNAVNRLLSTIAFISVVGVGLIVALGVLNLDKTVTSLLAGAGILGLAIGFAAQDTVENLIAGIMLSVRRPFREGELIESDGTFGVVKEINLRSTVIRIPSGQIVYVPNSSVFGSALTNYSELGTRRIDLSCGVSYADDLEKARRVAIEAIEGVEGRDTSRDVEFYYEEFGGSSINFKVRFWIDFAASNAAYLTHQSEAIIGLKRAFDANGISIPYPIRTLDFGIGAGGVPLADQLVASRG